MNVAFIPVRGGSKSIPLKNIKLLNGKPLVYWTIKAACGCKYIEKVFVATDSDKIKETVEGFKNSNENIIFEKVEIINRSEESASDTASTEFAMLEFAGRYIFDNIVLIQATSPLLTSSDIDRGFEVFNEPGTDSVLSVVRQKRFNWEVDDNKYAYPVNYDIFHRPRRQEFGGYLVENGAFYISRKDNLIKFRNRISGNIRTVEMNEDTFFEIDEPSDWLIIETLMKNKGICGTDKCFDSAMDISRNVPEIKMFLTDCDGCLTDGGMYYSEKGDELKKFNTRDGMAFKLLREHGIITGIVTSENVELNRRRAEKLKLDILEISCTDKVAIVKELCEKYGFIPENVVYVGDDINDIETIRFVGFGCCPNDAVDEVKNSAKYIAHTNGGEGVIREIADIIIDKMKKDVRKIRQNGILSEKKNEGRN